jgi:hypothetical protein
MRYAALGQRAIHASSRLRPIPSGPCSRRLRGSKLSVSALLLLFSTSSIISRTGDPKSDRITLARRASPTLHRMWPHIRFVLRFVLFTGITLWISLDNNAANAAGMTYYASPSGSGTGCSLTSPCALQSALNKAMSGDTVIAKDGTYNGGFYIRTRGGTSSAKITLKAEHKHKAIIKGAGQLDSSNIGFSISQPYWIVEGFKLTGHSVAFPINASGIVEIRHNIISDFHISGVVLRSNNHRVHHNVIAFAKEPFGDGSDTPTGIVLRSRASNNAIHDNIIYSMTNDQNLFSSNAKGSCAILSSGSQHNMFQGNICMDTSKQGVRIWSGNLSSNTSHNIFQDNIFAFSDGASGFGDFSSNYNKFINNIIYGVNFGGLAAKGNRPGQNEWRHNTVYVTEFDSSGLRLARNDDGVSEYHAIIKDNLFYSNNPNNGTQWLYHVIDWSAAIKESDYNLFWRPGSESKWTSNVTYGLNDIRSSSQKPVFVDEANGDFTLAPGSPGKDNASDGKDRGASFNASLKKSWMQNLMRLPTHVKSVSGTTNVSFSVSPSHQYRVHFYVPESNLYSGTEEFTIEGKTLSRDLGKLLSGGSWGSKYIGPAPQRWVYLGSHPNDGTLNISWQHSSAVSKILIRQLPTPEEAYLWIAGQSDSSDWPLPTNLRVMPGK